MSHLNPLVNVPSARKNDPSHPRQNLPYFSAVKFCKILFFSPAAHKNCELVVFTNTCYVLLVFFRSKSESWTPRRIMARKAVVSVYLPLLLDKINLFMHSFAPVIYVNPPQSLAFYDFVCHFVAIRSVNVIRFILFSKSCF